MIKTWGDAMIAIGVYSISMAMLGAQPSVGFGAIILIVGLLMVIFGTPPQEGQ